MTVAPLFRSRFVVILCAPALLAAATPKRELSIAAHERSPAPLQLNLGLIPASVDIPFSIIVTGAEPDGEAWESYESSCSCTATNFEPTFLPSGKTLSIAGQFLAPDKPGRSTYTQTLRFHSSSRILSIEVRADIGLYPSQSRPPLSLVLTPASTTSAQDLMLPAGSPHPGYCIVPETLRSCGVSIGQRVENGTTINVLRLDPREAYRGGPAPAVFPKSIRGEIVTVIDAPPEAATGSAGAFIIRQPVNLEIRGGLVPSMNEVDFGFIKMGDHPVVEIQIKAPPPLCRDLHAVAPEYIVASMSGPETDHRKLTLILNPEALPAGRGFRHGEVLVTAFGEALKIPIRYAR